MHAMETRRSLGIEQGSKSITVLFLANEKHCRPSPLLSREPRGDFGCEFTERLGAGRGAVIQRDRPA